jgi:hypothetical protein
VLSKHPRHNACWHVPFMLCDKRKPAPLCTVHAGVCLCAVCQHSLRQCQAAMWQRESGRNGCAIEVHTPACFLYRTCESCSCDALSVPPTCLCHLRVLQTCSMCFSKQCGSGGTDRSSSSSSSSISAGARCADCTHADVSCCVPCMLRVILPRVWHMCSLKRLHWSLTPLAKIFVGHTIGHSPCGTAQLLRV